MPGTVVEAVGGDPFPSEARHEEIALEPSSQRGTALCNHMKTNKGAVVRTDDPRTVHGWRRSTHPLAASRDVACRTKCDSAPPCKRVRMEMQERVLATDAQPTVNRCTCVRPRSIRATWIRPDPRQGIGTHRRCAPADNMRPIQGPIFASTAVRRSPSSGDGCSHTSRSSFTASGMLRACHGPTMSALDAKVSRVRQLR